MRFVGTLYPPKAHLWYKGVETTLHIQKGDAMLLTWETIERHGEQDTEGNWITYHLTERTQAADGWLVRTTRHEAGKWAMAMAFVPDPAHTWKP